MVLFPSRPVISGYDECPSHIDLFFFQLAVTLPYHFTYFGSCDPLIRTSLRHSCLRYLLLKVFMWFGSNLV